MCLKIVKNVYKQKTNVNAIIFFNYNKILFNIFGFKHLNQTSFIVAIAAS